MNLRNLFFWQKRKKPECATERCFFWKELECDKHVKNPSIHGHDCPIHQDLFYHYPCSHCNKIDTCDRIFYGHGCLANQRERDHEIYGEKEICYTKNGVEITERDREYGKIYNHTFFHTNFYLCIYKINIKKKKIAVAEVTEKDGKLYIEIEDDTIYRKAMNLYDLILNLRIEGVL